MSFTTKTITLKINKKGRKYFKAQFPNGQREYDLVIDETSKALEVGKNYILTVQEYKQEKPFKITYVAISVDATDIKDKDAKLIAEINKYLAYVEEIAKNEGRLYKKGATIVENNLKKLKRSGIEAKRLVERYELATRYQQAKIKAHQEIVERYLTYVRDTLENQLRWYHNGEEKIKESLSILRKAGANVKDYEFQLKGLRQEFKFISKSKPLTAEELEAFRLETGTYRRCCECHSVEHISQMNNDGMCQDCESSI